MTSGQPEHDSRTASSPGAGFRAQVRGQALWAGIAACIMLYFGLRTGSSDNLSGDVLRYTLVYGGICMAVSTLLLLSGQRLALLFDGLVAMAVGGALILSGLLWFGYLRTIDLTGILGLVFGYLFFTSGLRNYKDYVQSRPLASAASDLNSPEEPRPPGD